MTKLTGPAGGHWVHAKAIGRDVPSRCDECGAMVTESWQWYVGLISHVTLCMTCAATLIDNDDPKEVTTMEGITPAIIAEVALALEAANIDWQEGRAASPDANDFVLITEGILEQRLGPEHLWLGDDSTLREAIATRESVANDLYERQCNGELNEWPEMAEWLIGHITVQS